MRWIKWALGEGLFRTASMILSKIIGDLSSSFAHLILSTSVIGIVQTIVAGIVIRHKKINAFPGKRLVGGSILFGVGAFVCTVLPFSAYMLGANITVYTSLTLLAIIPGALIDWVWFGEKLAVRQGVGIVLALGAGWLVLKAPSFHELADLPVWVWLALLNAIGLSLNQGITRWVKEVDVWVKNFWGGLTTALLCGVTLVIFGDATLHAISSPDIVPVLWWSVAIAFLVIGIWSFNVIAYRDGAAIPTKNVFVNGIFLTGATFAGLIIFGEEVLLLQIIGMLMYVVAFVLTNNEVWRYVSTRHVARG